MPLDIKKVKNKMFLKNNVQLKTLFMYPFIVENTKPFFNQAEVPEPVISLVIGKRHRGT